MNYVKKAMSEGFVYMNVLRGMYGLPQAGALGHGLLKTRLNQEGYYQIKVVPSLWKKSIQFVLVVSDFVIKYLKKEDLYHLIQTSTCIKR